MKGLTAKVFRTYNASITFQEQLDKLTPEDGTVAEKLAAYNVANRLVAKLCNHQKSVSKNHAASMEKIGNQVYPLSQRYTSPTDVLLRFTG
jgi:DNA topoisomerase I